MKWHKVMNDLYTHPKVLALPPKYASDCMYVWHAALCAVSRHDTDGFLSVDTLETLPIRLTSVRKKRAIQSLLDAEMLTNCEQNDRKGYRFPNFAKHQESEKEQRKRELARERVRRHRNAVTHPVTPLRNAPEEKRREEKRDKPAVVGTPVRDHVGVSVSDLATATATAGLESFMRKTYIDEYLARYGNKPTDLNSYSLKVGDILDHCEKHNVDPEELGAHVVRKYLDMRANAKYGPKFRYLTEEIGGILAKTNIVKG